jgi:hypothetical protein
MGCHAVVMCASQAFCIAIVQLRCMVLASSLSGLLRVCRGILIGCSLIVASGCGGGSQGETPAEVNDSKEPVPAVGSMILAPPVLRFTDTGLSVSDGVTRTGLWSVSSSDGLGWEFSLDFGKNWTRGEGGSFEVIGDGQKTIWVRARDDLGNTSEIVVAKCTLDTMAPAAVLTVGAGSQSLRELSVQGLEPNARWEFSLDQGRSWMVGGFTPVLSVAGNGLSSLQLRQTDVAGNPSAPVSVDLQEPGMGWIEGSGNPMMPTALGSMTRSVLLHGEVVAGDADYVSVEIPTGHRLTSAAFVHYDSPDKIAFYAMQRGALFDAGFDTAKMLAFGHFGPEDLKRNVVAGVAPAQLGPGPLTFWIQQTGQLVTRYALLLSIDPVP